MKQIKQIIFFSSLLVTAAAFAQPHRHVDRVIDGDTIVLDGKEHVRLIGINAPEIQHRKPVQCFGSEARDYLKRRLEGKDVVLKYDRQRLDKYNRTLAYIYLNHAFINEEMIKNGYAIAYRRFPFKYKKAFVKAEQGAREERLGMWGEWGGKDDLKEY